MRARYIIPIGVAVCSAVFIWALQAGREELKVLDEQTKAALVGSFLDEKNYVKSELVEDFWKDYGINDMYAIRTILVSPNRRYYLTGSCQAYLVDIEQSKSTYLGSPNGSECYISVGFSNDSTKAYFYGENWLNVEFYYTDGRLIDSYEVASNPYIEAVEFSEDSKSAEIHTSSDGTVLVEFNLGSSTIE